MKEIITLNDLLKCVMASLNKRQFQRIPRLVCNDGFSMSVQVGEHLYCNPRDNNGPWIDAEVGYPSEEEILIENYAEDESNLIGTVYGYVPIDIIEKVIYKHGGISKDYLLKTVILKEKSK